MFDIPIQIQWLHLDPNGHVRHSAYYDFCAYARVQIMHNLGLSIAQMKALHVGPILFREEAIFKREIHLEDELVSQTALCKASPDYNRWSFRHHLVKKDGTVAAIVTVDGAWLDTTERKIAALPENFQTEFEAIPKTKDFEWVVKR